ncbi:hypothetical protein ACFQS2_08825 [Brachybacterium sp. GCM10030267]|uniref:hypothetical protein n=1 Tax=Brachybacterium sp. GCM10030267 TaxID=3273381 RepID=UPI003607C276
MVALPHAEQVPTGTPGMPWPTGPRRGGRVPRAVALVLVTVSLGGCGLFGEGGRGAAPTPGWEHDESSDRYYVPGEVSHSTDLVDEHFPGLAEVTAVSVAEGRFTDPDERVPIPAPDDYWWQAVIELPPGEAARLVAETRAQQASDGGDYSTLAQTMSEGELLAVMVPALEPEISPCPGDWISVHPAVIESSNTTVAGDLLEAAVVCEGGEQLLTSARDM